MGNTTSGIQRALDLYETTTALAAACGEDVKRQNIEHWLALGYVPVGKCHKVANATGIPVEELNPLHDWAGVRRALDLKTA